MPDARKLTVLFDGHCGLCCRTRAVLSSLDWLKRLEFVDIHDAAGRERAAPDKPFAELSRVIHVKMPDGSYRTGFQAFQAICWCLPTLWLLIPLLYLPGAAPVGHRVYAWIAARRSVCHDGSCALHH